MDTMTAQDLRAEIARIDAVFAAAGATLCAPDALIPADMVLDLYGEDIRARAFLLSDPTNGELALRPDFTAPVARMHLDSGAQEARYRYAGPVFRRQAAGSGRPREYPQVGFEIIGAQDRIAADVDTFMLIRAALGDLAIRARIGDIAIAFAAIGAIPGPQRWRDALTRSFWRPPAFRRILSEIGPDRPAPTPERAALLEVAEKGRAALDSHLRDAFRQEGRRGLSDVADRLMDLAEDAARPPLSADDVAGLEAVLAVSGPAPQALAALSALNRPELAPGLAAMEQRIAAVAAAGAPPEEILLDASFGRALEYYDGFVFEFTHPRADAALGGGGRYDALMARLGGARTPAIGGVVRPQEVIAARRGRR